MLKRAFLLSAVMLASVAGAQVKNPGILTDVEIGDWRTFDPADCYEQGCGEILQNVLETLYFPEGENASKFVPQLAAAMPEVTNGGKTYTIKLRKGVKFTNGQPLTADDVVYSIQRSLVLSVDGGPAQLLIEPLLGSTDLIRKGGKIGFDDIAKAIQAKGDDTVVFNLAAPFSAFISILASPYANIYNKDEAVKAGDWSGTAKDWEKFNNPEAGTTMYAKKPPVGTGAFVLERYDVGQNVILKRNDAYWRAPAKLTRVIVQNVSDENTRIKMLEAGDADLAFVNRPSIPRVKGSAGVKIIEDTTLSLTAFFMNQKINGQGTNYLGSGKLDGNGIPSNFFSDVNVRKGFAAAMDYDALIKDVLLGAATHPSSVIVKGLLGYSTNLPKYKYDKNLATKYLKAAWKGQVWKNGFTLPVFFNSGNTKRKGALEILKKNLESLNPKFKVEVRELPFSQVIAQGQNSQMTVWAGAWGADYADPHNFAFPFLQSSGNYPTQIGYKNTKLDGLISEAVTSTDSKKRVALYRQIQQIAYNDTPFIPLYQELFPFVQRDWVKGRLINPVFADDYYYTISK
ncbi:ABC transporter substrate-binding protein [Deinococcus roseus]|uniref:Peptide ABC transporter substrate-binding protein n=1 Tax=Deinococcus roseus TaxID=392414 RepID=A0ABQ2CVS5_9DEIO|nr:ABC transporter substrate-binding protein [Deinococcus roseus]GGJ25405.1 peptide ABC transporter substrate-binding protein [Deinococcus roseus]